MLLGDLAGIASDSEVTGFAVDHRKVVRGNVVFQTFGYGLHFYAQESFLRDFSVDGNVLFDPSVALDGRGARGRSAGGPIPPV